MSSLMDISSLQDCYLNACRRHGVPPNSAIVSWFVEANIQKSCHGKCEFVVLLNHVKDVDISPFLDVLVTIESSEIEAVDMLYHESPPCSFNEDYLLSLMNAVKLKLRLVDLRSKSLREGFLRDLYHGGLACSVLNLRSTHIQKLNMFGRFRQLQSLNLDFCTSLSSLQKDCFSHMPNLVCLSLCATQVANLWDTVVVLTKLPSLLELRFQNCQCCKDTGPCRALFIEDKTLVNQENICQPLKAQLVISGCDSVQASSVEEATKGLLALQNSCMSSEVHGRTNDSVHVKDDEHSAYIKREVYSESSSNLLHSSCGPTKLQSEIQEKYLHLPNVQKPNITHLKSTPPKYIWHHPSPICFEKHYREYMISHLTRLAVLDNIPIRKMERETAKAVYSTYYEYLPYKHTHKESVVSILQNREVGTSGVSCRNSSKLKQFYPYGKSQNFFSRALAAAKFGSASWPLLHPVTSTIHLFKGESKKLRPRQFEYHPSNSSLMVYGTLEGEVVVINHETGNIVGYNSSIGEMDSVLGLCWLNKYPSKIVAGSDNGCLKMFDINHMLPNASELSCSSSAIAFEDFEQLTSVHVNSTDDQLLASGYSKGVALYDTSSGKRLRVFTNMHQEPINVAKFANHSPFMFATSSFDKSIKMWDLRQSPSRPCYTASSSRGNVMLCFSPDDLYLLVSAIDNEVKQLLAVDGRLHLNFDIAQTGSTHNYTRSYYMNGRDYIISGSCDEPVVRICCSQTGRRLKDISLKGMEFGNPVFVQSLRGDPFRHFHLSILAVSTQPTSKQEIIKVNLLSSWPSNEYSVDEDAHSTCGLGG